MNRARGRCLCSAAIRRAPSGSPEASPATMPMVTCRSVTSAHDPAGAVLQKLGEQADFSAGPGLFGELRLGLIQGQAGLVNRLVGSLDCGQGVGGAGAPAASLG